MTIIILIGVMAVIAYLFLKIVAQVWLQRRKQSVLEKNCVAYFYSRDAIRCSTRHYVPPDHRHYDPQAGLNTSHHESLFETIDLLLDEESGDRYFILFADSGMGKSSFVLNYYARNELRSHRKRKRMAVIPLGRPDVETHIERLENKSETILFLDAFNEDTRAHNDHGERLAQLLSLCQEFRRVLITCRTQFFDCEKEAPAGMLRLKSKAGEKSHELKQLHLPALTHDQVRAYISNRFRFWQPMKRHRARLLVEKSPLLGSRTALLAYIPELINEDIVVDYTFQIYEILVNKWYDREVSWIDPTVLKQFSGTLAIELFAGRQKRGGEFLPMDEVSTFAAALGAKPTAWKLNGNSLLNRDAEGNFRFLNRSIMEFLFVKRFFEIPVNQRHKLDWTDQMKSFTWEMLKAAVKEGKARDISLEKVDLSEFPEPLYGFRTEPRKISNREALEDIKRHDFYCGGRCPWSHSEGGGVLHLYERLRDSKIIRDCLSGLYWQQSGSSKKMTYEAAQKYVRQLNDDQFAGFSDWRLPTLEEAMSLMKPQKNKGGLYSDPIFDKSQKAIWTSDKKFSLVAWYVDFGRGYCNVNFVYDALYSVRAVH